MFQMKRYYSVILFFCLFLSDLAAAGEESANWTELLFKSVNFFLLVGAIWFFFGKKIISALRSIAQGEHQKFFSHLKNKNNFRKELDEKQSKLEQILQKMEIAKKEAFEKIDKENVLLEKESKKQIEKIKKNAETLLEQEYNQAKKLFYKKVFNETLNKFEKAVKSGSIIIDQKKYFSQFINQVNLKNFQTAKK